MAFTNEMAIRQIPDNRYFVVVVVAVAVVVPVVYGKFNPWSHDIGMSNDDIFRPVLNRWSHEAAHKNISAWLFLVDCCLSPSSKCFRSSFVYVCNRICI